MKTTKFLAVVALSILAAGANVAFADEADASQYVHQFEGNRTRAEVQVEAVQAARNRSAEPAGSRVLAPVQSTQSRADVQALTVQAARQGKTSYGEAGAL